MTTARRTVSIHDYPEHLNPFSETHLTRRKVFVDKLHKNSTWSSKISKRLSRSVSWLEKTWLTTEESSNKPRPESRICTKIHETNAIHFRPNPDQINRLSRTESCSDIKNERTTDETLKRTHISTLQNGNAVLSEACCNSGVEIKKRKKRPAPRPPGNESNDSLPSEVKIPEPINGLTDIEQEKQSERVTNYTEKTEKQNANEEESSSRKEVTETCISNSPEQIVAVTDTPMTTILEQDLQNLKINDQCEKLEQCVPDDTKNITVCEETTDVNSEEKAEEISSSKPESPSPVPSLDENANVSASEELKSDKKNNLLPDVRCNGQAVMV